MDKIKTFLSLVVFSFGDDVHISVSNNYSSHSCFNFGLLSIAVFNEI